MTHRWVDDHGDWWDYTPPATVAEVLHVEALLTHDLKRAVATETTLTPDAVAPLLGELVRRTTACSVPGWESMTHPERVEVLDTHCSVQWRLDYWRAMVEAVSLPEDTLEALGEYLDLEFGGGCECPVCSGDRPDGDRAEVWCLRARVPLHVSHLAGLYLPVQDDPILHQPWWLHQVRVVWRAAEGRAHRAMLKEARRERERQAERRRVLDKINQLGGAV